MQFGAGYIKNLASSDGRTMTFLVPAALDTCPPPTLGLAMPCSIEQPPVTAGTYMIALVARGAKSNAVPFTVTAK